MSSWAAPGVKCVCIGRERKPGEPVRINDRGYRELPKRGQIYTITGAFADAVWGVFLYLEGFPQDHGFHIEAFRPLASQSDDVALFRHHLDGIPSEVSA